MSTFDEAQAAVEAVIDEHKLLDDIEKSGTFRDLVCKQRARLVGATQAEASTSSRAEAEVKLSKFNLPTFDGKVEKWLLFWESFETCVHTSDLPDVQKLSYLRSLLKGEAARSVEGLALTAKNYDAAVDILKKRYGRPEKLIFLHIQSLSNLKEPNLVALQDSLLSHIRGLEALDVSGEKYGIILTPLVLSKLPESVRMEWARTSEHHEGDLSHPLEFLNSEIRRQDRSSQCARVAPSRSATPPPSGDLPARSSNQFTCSRMGSTGMVTRQGGRQPPTAAALAATAKCGDANRCGMCNKGHGMAKCPVLLKLSARDRHLEVRNKGLCFRCLTSGHRAAACDATCEKCKGRHHSVLCFQETKPDPKVPDVNLSCTSGGVSAVLPTASVVVKGVHGDVKATLLFDTGSNRSYVSSFVKRSAPEFVRTEELRYAAFGGKESDDGRRHVFSLVMQGANVAEPKVVEVKAAEVPVICAPLVQPIVYTIPVQVLSSLGNLELADTQVGNERAIDILIGLDFY